MSCWFEALPFCWDHTEFWESQIAPIYRWESGGGERGGVHTICLHTICWHIPHSTYSWSWCSGLIYTYSMMVSFPPHMPLFGGILHQAQAFLGSEEMAVLFLSFYATLRSGHFLDEAMLGPFWHTPDRHFPWDFWYQRPWTKKTKDDSSALRFCRIVWPSQRSAWEHQDTSHVSLLPESPLLPPTSLSLIPLIPHPHRPRLMEFFWQICLGWQRGVRVRRRSNLGDPLFLESKSQDSEKQKPGEDSFFLLLSVNTYFSWSISRECPRLRVKVRSKVRKYQEGTSINIVQILFLIH